MNNDHVKMLHEGIDIGEKRNTLPAKLEILQDNRSAYITITEGKFHQVKRMFKALDRTVTYLKRVRMGSLVLDVSLKPGEFRSLTEEEIRKLKTGN